MQISSKRQKVLYIFTADKMCSHKKDILLINKPSEMRLSLRAVLKEFR